VCSDGHIELPPLLGCRHDAAEWYDHTSVDPVDPKPLLRIFGPLLLIEVGGIEVGIGVEVPEAVRDVLGSDNLKLDCHRPYDGRICLQV
jgi:hypothetical protein